MDRRRILYLSGTRADFGLMQGALRTVHATPGLQVQVAVTGTHLSAAHGSTVDEVRASGLPIAAEIPIDVLTRSGASMALAVAEVLRAITTLIDRERPDVVLVLGDRGEMLAAATAALHVGIPCVHVHGGERSGSVDDLMRHAISKLASYHFVATSEASDRLRKMGEPADRIFITGAPGLDGLREFASSSRDECVRDLGLPAQSGFVLAVFHPVVQQAADAVQQAQALVRALQAVALPVLWVEPNADAGARAILQVLDEQPLPSGSQRIRHLPRARFAAAMRHCAVMAGNSSSGIIEAATFGTPVVDIGDRQRQREHGPNVLHAAPSAEAIEAALRAQLGHGRWPCDNPWGNGHAGAKIAQLLASLPLDGGVLEKANSY